MKNYTFLNLIGLVISVQSLFSGQQIWAAPTCAEIFGESFDRTVYIEQTSQQSRLKVVAQTIFTGATALQLGTPTMLRGVQMKGFFWVRDGHLLRGMKRAYGEGASPWGNAEIFTQSGVANTLEITITPLAGFRALTREKVGLLQELFPSLIVSSKGSSDMRMGSREVVPDKIKFTLDRSKMPSDESFEASSRSLVTTLLNDPKGLLGLNPKSVIAKYELPRKLKSETFLTENLDFFGNFGQWKNVFGAAWSSYKRRNKNENPSLRDTGLRIDLNTQEMSFWLENASYINEATANIRRVVWSLLELGYDRNIQPLPRTKINGINGVTVAGLKFDEISMALVKVLDAAQNNLKFNQPLTHLNTKQKQFVSDWFLRNFDQSDLPEQQTIRFENIVDQHK